MDKRELTKNIIVAFFAQGISLFLSFLISFIMPKILSVDGYSYWQLFIFYTSYVGLFHFGINDGIYLRYGGQEFNKLNKEYISGQFKILLLIQFLLFALLGAFFSLISINYNRKIVVFLTLFYMIVFNLSNYLGYIFQGTNNTKWYSYSIIIDKVFFSIGLIFLILCQEYYYFWYILMYLFGKIICLLYCIFKAKNILFVKVKEYKKVLSELKRNVKSGIKLTISSIMSMLILGVGRFLIDSNWGIVVFGKISFSLSLTNFALVFISQVGMVFFPALRRLEKKQQISIYNRMISFCFFIMPVIYLLMTPVKNLLEIWLPTYSDSLGYLSILLPICIFDAKMNMIFNTYFKVLRHEKILLLINISSFVISCILSGIGAYIINSYMFILIAMVITIIFRSVLSELIINKIFEKRDYTKLFIEVIFAIIYIITSLLFNQITGLFILIFIYILIIILYRKQLKIILLQK